MDDFIAMQSRPALDRVYTGSAQKAVEPLGAKLDRILDIALKLAQSAESLCDKIDGPRPMGNVSGSEETAPSSPALMSVADRIQDRLHRATASLERLHGLT
jgi:hypothetical protein